MALKHQHSLGRSVSELWCGANFSKNVCMTSQDLSQWRTLLRTLVGEARLDNVTPEDGTELLHSHGQQLSKEDLEELDRELSQQ